MAAGSAAPGPQTQGYCVGGSCISNGTVLLLWTMMLFRGSTVKTFGLRQMNAGKEKGPQLLDKLLLKQLEAPGHVLVLWLEGIWRPLSAPVRWLLFCRLCPAPGCWLSHEYPVTHTNETLQGI